MKSIFNLSSVLCGSGNCFLVHPAVDREKDHMKKGSFLLNSIIKFVSSLIKMFSSDKKLDPN